MKFVAYIENTIVMVAMAGMACITFANVLSRYFFDTSFAFAEEITINLFVLATFVGASIAIKRQAHFGFHYFFTKFNPTIQRVLVILTSLLMLFFLSLTLIFGMELVLNQMERGRVTPALTIPQWIFTGAIPLGSLLCMIRTVEVMMIRLKKNHQLPLPKTEVDSKEMKM
ncbi:TRAP transporter small permease [Shouchella lehensis]|uniref:C4-dicarboxylate transport system permease small protein n=1 Tax=Shouchella lehensis G1 TaxID=1246626 RepID=A0A060LXI1_9BACI|nr:TRAP transporter small permease [Shouchella lehensis]AIC94475.1 C4-dicarboxylate transport system permease small protein [Shouchella lehensis G1]